MAAVGQVKRAFAALLIAAALALPAPAQQSNVRLIEQDIKAGLLYNFLLYTAWPAAAQSEQTIVVCLYGDDPFDGRLAPMAGRTVNQRTIVVRAARENREFDGCALLFINAQKSADWPRLRSYLARKSVLTVSDFDGFARTGGILEFTQLNNRIGVRVNVGAAAEANLSVQDRLLRLASVVRTDKQ